MNEAKFTPGPWTHDAAGETISGFDRFGERQIVVYELGTNEADARLITAALLLLEACKAQHNAIDWLMARLIGLDPEFRPTKSPVWETVLLGNAAIAAATPT